jgi:hypothetical protein
MNTETEFCYSCARRHPVDEMRQILTKTGMRWRCIKSIEAARQGRAEREAFGSQTTANNGADRQAQIQRMPNPERKAD